jgi:copper oxidase (laccase) domain-containing protein
VLSIEIAIDPQCVYTESGRYFSYRRDGKTGRMASLIFRD